MYSTYKFSRSISTSFERFKRSSADKTNYNDNNDVNDNNKLR